jgi:dCTP deaminase
LKNKDDPNSLETAGKPVPKPEENPPMAPSSPTAAAAEATSELFPAPEGPGPVPAPRHSTGILPSQSLREMIRAGEIAAAEPITEAQIQPASLDLRLGRKAYRVRASFLPGPETAVQEMVDALGMHEIELGGGAVLERGCVYIVPLKEHLKLGYRVTGFANPKSSSGRLDVFTRLIVDRAIAFDRVEDNYAGPLYAEIAPRTFSVLVREGDTLNQLRIRRGSPRTTDTSLKRLQEEVTLVHGEPAGANIDHGIAVSVDLEGLDPSGLIGYRARRHAGLVDLAKVGHYEAEDFWEPIYRRREARLVLDPDDFYILASREAVTVPPDHAAEMLPFNPLVGEFRVHYAGFFDPGFGYAGAGGQGARAVLEIRSREVPFVLEHGQTVARLIYERLTAEPDKIYGPEIGSNYQRQGLKLSKQFKRRD